MVLQVILYCWIFSPFPALSWSNLIPYSLSPSQQTSGTPVEWTLIRGGKFSSTQSWEFIKEREKNKKKRKKTRPRQRKRERKKESFFFSWSLFWSRACFLSFFLVCLIAFLVEFLFSYFLVFFNKFPPQWPFCHIGRTYVVENVIYWSLRIQYL